MRRRDILLQAAVLPIVAALGAYGAGRGVDAVRRRDRAQPGARPGAEGVAGARCHAARLAEEPGVSGLPLDPVRSWPRAVAWPGAALHRRVLPSRLPLQGGGQDLRGRQRPRRTDPLQPGPVHLRQGEAARPPTSASPASACTTRSTAPTISTRSAPFSAPAISALWRRTRATGCRRGGSRSRPRIPPARSSRCSASFWLERPGKGSDTIVVHALLDSPSAAAAFRFTIRPGKQTVFDTEMALYPRTDLADCRYRAAHLDVPVRRQRPHARR